MRNPALDVILEMAKTVDPNEDLILIQKSAMKVAEDGQTITLDCDSDVSDVIKGADLADLESDVDEIEKNSNSAEAIAEFGKSFVALCKSVGLDPKKVVEDAEPKPEIGKGLTEERIMQIVKDAVGAPTQDRRIDELAETLDGIVKRLDGETLIQPRKGAGGDGSGAPAPRILKSAAEGGDGQEIQKRLDGLYQKRDALIAKMDAGQALTPQEQVERNQIGTEIDRLEAAQSAPPTRVVAG